MDSPAMARAQAVPVTLTAARSQSAAAGAIGAAQEGGYGAVTLRLVGQFRRSGNRLQAGHDGLSMPGHHVLLISPLKRGWDA